MGYGLQQELVLVKRCSVLRATETGHQIRDKHGGKPFEHLRRFHDHHGLHRIWGWALSHRLDRSCSHLAQRLPPVNALLRVSQEGLEAGLGYDGHLLLQAEHLGGQLRENLLQWRYDLLAQRAANKKQKYAQFLVVCKHTTVYSRYCCGCCRMFCWEVEYKQPT